MGTFDSRCSLRGRKLAKQGANTAGVVGLLFVLIVVGFSPLAMAVPYFGDEVFTYHQPDGSTFGVRLYGDEFFAYQRTAEDGREVVKDESTGFWCYAKLSADGRSFVSTGIPVVTAAKDTATAQAQPIPSSAAEPFATLPIDAALASAKERKEELAALGRDYLAAGGIDTSSRDSLDGLDGVSGTIRGVTILVDFPDEPGTIPQADVARFLNQPSNYTDYGNACSVNEYFYIQSNGKLDYRNVVTPYITMPHPKYFYDDDSLEGAKPALLVSTALDILNSQGFDFTGITATNIFYTGNCESGWSRGLWPHCAGSYQMTEMGNSLRIGTFCHENGHMICGFPDLYSYTAHYAGIPGSIVSDYCLMCAGGGTHPPNFCAVLKEYAGWADIVEVPYNTTPMRALLQTDRNRFYKYANPDRPNEYFLLENRNDTGFEGPYGGAGASVPGRGLVVWHVDESGSNMFNPLQNPDVTPEEELFKTPYFAFIIEAEPPSGDKWYGNPSPAPDENDTFHAGHGADPLYSYWPLPNNPVFGEYDEEDPENPEDLSLSRPDLSFWNREDYEAGRDVISKLVLHSFGEQGHFMPFVIGINPTGAFPIDIFEVSGSPVIDITAHSISARCDFGQNPADQYFRLFNRGGQGALYFEVDNSESWLLCSPSSGYAQPVLAGQDIMVSFDATGLAPGQYTDTFIVTTPDQPAVPLPINVTLTVEEQYELEVTPPEIDVTLAGDQPSMDNLIDVWNKGGGSMKYTVTSSVEDGPWIWLEPARTSGLCVGGIHESLHLYITPIDVTQTPPILPMGDYTGYLDVTAPGAIGSPQSATVNLSVGGLLAVVSPNGGEVWEPGLDAMVPIEWGTNTDEAVSIELVKWDEGTSTYVVVEDIASAIPYDGDPDGDGRSTYMWPLPRDIGNGNPNIEPGADYRIRVFSGTDWGTAEFKDESDVDFRIFRTAYKTDMSEEPLEEDVPGWMFEGAWAWGTPTGKRSGDSIGNPDPKSGYSGSTLIGYMLGDDEAEEYTPGDYENNIGETEYATLGPIDCSYFADTKLTFRRWLGVEKTDSAVIEISIDGENWDVVWQNPLDGDITDGDEDEWTRPVTYDISAYADNRSSVWLRWGMGPTDDFWRSGGWNLDDLAVHGRYWTGSLQVNLGPEEAVTAGARWRRVGTETWFDSGYTEEYITFGPYTVEFKEVPDWVSPENVDVVITLDETTEVTATYYQVGLLQVTITPPEAVDAGAQWRLAGTETWFDSDDAQELPVGEYVVEFKPVDLWRLPDPIGVTIEHDQTTSVSRAYYQRGSLEVILGPPEAVEAGAQWRRVGEPDWLDSGYVEEDLEIGPYAIEFKPVNLWRTPNSVNAMVNPDQTTTVSADYYQRGSLEVTIEPAAAVTAGAQWRRTGTEDWLDSGATEEDLEIGPYDIEFKPVNLWRTPEVISVTIEPEETATETGTYYQMGSLQVMIEPAAAVTAGAQWRRVGTETWLDSGATEEDLEVGSYDIEFKPVSLWRTPDAISVTIAPEETTTETASYYQAGSIQVTIAPEEAVEAGAQWRRTGTAEWFNSGDTEQDVLVGDYVIEFKPITGWLSPDSASVKVAPEQTAMASGTYRQTGSLRVTIEPAAAVAAGAQWRRTGTETWLDSGATEQGLLVGNYTVEFKAVQLWRTPKVLYVTIEPQATTTETVSYYQAGSLQVMIEPENPRPDGAQWRRVGSSIWHNSWYTEDDVPVGDYAVEFSAVNGWIVPDTIPVTIETDEKTAVTGVYVKATGSLQVTIEPQDARDDGAEWRRLPSAGSKSVTEVVEGTVFRIGEPVLNGGVLEVPLVLFRGDDALSQDTFTGDGLFAGGPAPAVIGFDVVYDPAVLHFSTEKTAEAGEAAEAPQSVEVSENLRNWYGHEVTVTEPEGPNSGRVRMVFVDSAFNRPVTTADNVREGGNPEEAQNPFVLATMRFECPVEANASTSLLIENVAAATAGEQMLEAVEGQAAVVKVDQGSGWLPSGATEDAIDPGTYTVEFKEVLGWETPASKEVIIDNGETTTASGTYVEIPSGSLRITIEPEEVVTAGAQWRRVGTEEWFDSALAEKHIPVGDYEVEFKEVSGWNTPENQTVTIAEDETTETTVEYTVLVHTGSLEVTINPRDAVTAGAQWRRTGTEEWFDSGSSETGIPIGFYTVEFKPVTDWSEPAEIEEILVEANTTATATGVYTAEVKPWSCPLFNNKAFQPFAEASVYERVLPSMVDESGARPCAPVAPLAIRLRSGEAIDPDTVWGVVSWSEGDSEQVLWLPLNDNDGWAVFEPEEAWLDGEAVTFTAGAYTVSGQEVGPFAYEFVVNSDVYEGRATVVESGSTTGDPEFVGMAYEVAPNTVYFEPLTVQLPVPEGVDAGSLEPAYLFTGEDGERRWVDGTHVIGWLEPGSVCAIETEDGVYLEFQVNHGGTVQLRRRVVSVSSAGMNNETVNSDLLLFLALCGVLVFQKRWRGRRSL